MARLGKGMFLGLALLALAACRSETEAQVDAQLSQWLWPEKRLYFQARSRCTVAVYRLDLPGLRAGVRQALTPREGLQDLRDGRAVAFVDPALTPDSISSAVMGMQLPSGLGLLGVAMTARDCMDDTVAQGVNRMLTTPGILTLFDPAERVLVLVDWQTRRAVFMRDRRR